MRVAIENGRIIDPASGRDEPGTLQINAGLIAPHSPQFDADQTIDASGCIVIPGLVDLRARVREPGEAQKGSIRSETRAAAAGGITTLAVPPDTIPAIDSAAVVELIHHKVALVGAADVVPIGALTAQLKGEQLSNMGALKRSGCSTLSNANRPITNSLVMRRALEYAATHDLTVMIHPNDPWLSHNGCVHEGSISTRLGLPGIPDSAETAAVARDLVLIRETAVRAHFCGLSSRNALQLITQAHEDGLAVSCDVAAHHLYLTEMDIGNFNSLCHLLPPLRTDRDRDSLIAGVRNGTIGIICSDHQPHDRDAKAAPFEETAPGASTLETLLPLVLRLAREQQIPLAAALATVTSNPARLLGIDVGSLAAGKVANITIFDPDRWWQVSPEHLRSAGKNSPFLQWEMQGEVTHTLLHGELVYQR